VPGDEEQGAFRTALGVSVERLIMAVAQVGAMADDVRAELRRQRR